MDAPQNGSEERSEDAGEDNKDPSMAESLELQDSQDKKQAEGKEALEVTKDPGNASMQEPQDSPHQKRNEDSGYGPHRATAGITMRS